MRSIIILALLAVGCASPGRRPLAEDVRTAAFPEYSSVTVVYRPYVAPPFADAAKNLTVVLHPGWVWEPAIYQKGAVIREILVAQVAQDGNYYRARANVAADACGIPQWAVPGLKDEDKRQATEWFARVDLEGGRTFRQDSHMQAGWPVFFYRGSR